MMNILEEAIVYATVMHQGKVRKFVGTPYILHPLEVAQILSTMTNDQEIITAGILHDIVEDTDGTLAEIEKRFGQRVAFLVSSESEERLPDEDEEMSWKRRKESSIRALKNTRDNGVRMLWLADKLSNIRSLAGLYSEHGEAIWKELHQSDPDMQLWYYKSIAETLELSLNKTGAFKELIKHINFMWPGTFNSDKARYKKYREVSVEGCKSIGHGAKGDVYRYDDELIIKVFNQNNTYHDVEQEIAISRKAFIKGIPTAISFGIVSVGECYGAMYELVDSETVSTFIAKNPGQIETYAKIMSDVAHTIHSIEVTDEDGFPSGNGRILEYINGGLSYEDPSLCEKCRKLIEGVSSANTLVHGDFHTNNVFLQNGEPLLIDMDRMASGHPIFEISDLYCFYDILGEDDPKVIENFMGFSYELSMKFFDLFMRNYLDTDDENRINEVKEKAAIICYARMIRKIYKKGTPSPENRKIIDRYLKQLSELTAKYDTLDF